jgi:hypothetical protein
MQFADTVAPDASRWADRVLRVDRSPRWLLPAVLAALVLAVIVGALVNL